MLKPHRPTRGLAPAEGAALGGAILARVTVGGLAIRIPNRALTPLGPRVRRDEPVAQPPRGDVEHASDGARRGEASDRDHPARLENPSKKCANEPVTDGNGAPWPLRWVRSSVQRCSRPLTASLAALTLLLVTARARADYPIASHRYLADPGSVVIGDRVYLYNSNDDDNTGNGYSMRSIVCVSSADMKNWTDHGIVFQVPADATWAHDSWAPQPIVRDGKIYLYFGNNANGIGVATSTDPAGRFKDARTSALVTGSTPGASGSNIWLFDPGALIDDDGQAYLAFGGNGQNNARIIKLGADLTTVSGSATQLAPTGFFEASFLFKRKGTYYYAYSSDSAHGLRIDYLMSSSPMSGYKYAGTIADQPPSNNNNNHASEFEFKGQWYHAYHNRIVSTEAKVSTTYKRNLALEVLSFNEDDTIKEVTYTKDGVPQVEPLNPYERVEAETTNAQSGIETEPCKDGGMDVTSLDANDWIRVRGVDFGAGAKSFSARVASTKAGGSIEVHLGTMSGMLAATCSVPSTGAAQTFMTTTCDVSGATGVSDVYFVFKGSGSQLFNFDSWQFTAADGGNGSGSAGGGSGGGGAAGTAGTTTTGGGGSSPSGGAGAPGSAGSGVDAAPETDSGCSCRIVQTRQARGWWLLVAFSALALRRRRKALGG